MEDFIPTDPRIFIAICVAYVVLAFFFLGARKVYFEPYDASSDE